jgi:hypothetical protein
VLSTRNGPCGRAGPVLSTRNGPYGRGLPFPCPYSPQTRRRGAGGRGGGGGGTPAYAGGASLRWRKARGRVALQPPPSSLRDCRGRREEPPGQRADVSCRRVLRARACVCVLACVRACGRLGLGLLHWPFSHASLRQHMPIQGLNHASEPYRPPLELSPNGLTRLKPTFCRGPGTRPSLPELKLAIPPLELTPSHAHTAPRPGGGREDEWGGGGEGGRGGGGRLS